MFERINCRVRWFPVTLAKICDQKYLSAESDAFSSSVTQRTVKVAFGLMAVCCLFVVALWLMFKTYGQVDPEMPWDQSLPVTPVLAKGTPGSEKIFPQGRRSPKTSAPK